MPFSGQNEGKEEADIEWEEVGITAGGQFKLSIWRQVSLVWVTSSTFLKLIYSDISDAWWLDWLMKNQTCRIHVLMTCSEETASTSITVKSDGSMLKAVYYWTWTDALLVHCHHLQLYKQDAGDFTGADVFLSMALYAHTAF